MPFYEYLCTNCGNKLEELQKMSDPPLTHCPKCGKDTLKRLIGTGAGIIFKGSGFYQTDYKKSAKPSGETTVTDTTSSGSSPGEQSSKSTSSKETSSKTTKKETKKKDK